MNRKLKFKEKLPRNFIHFFHLGSVISRKKLNKDHVWSPITLLSPPLWLPTTQSVGEDSSAPGRLLHDDSPSVRLPQTNLIHFNNLSFYNLTPSARLWIGDQSNNLNSSIMRPNSSLIYRSTYAPSAYGAHFPYGIFNPNTPSSFVVSPFSDSNQFQEPLSEFGSRKWNSLLNDHLIFIIWFDLDRIFPTALWWLTSKPATNCKFCKDSLSLSMWEHLQRFSHFSAFFQFFLIILLFLSLLLESLPYESIWIHRPNIHL